MSTRRNSLAQLAPQPTTNAGLWLDKYIFEQVKSDKESRRNLVAEVADIKVPEEYSLFFHRWKATLTAHGAQPREMKISGRMAVGHGGEGVLETALTLHRTYGVPYLPGSALKGLAASFARTYCGDQWKPKAYAYNIVFGDTDSAGYVTFFDALPLDGQTKLLHPDVLTVHHQDYYRNGSAPPADWDSPNPVPFLSASGTYLLFLAGPTEMWINTAFDILAQALQHEGIGAKTSSGYGRASLLAAPTPPPPPDPAVTHVDEEVVVAKVISRTEVEVETQDGAQVRCTGMRLYPKAKVGDPVIATVTREDGRAVTAMFLEWADESD